LRRQLAFRLVEKILALARVRLSWQALRPIQWLLRRPFGVLAAARALIVRTLPAGSTRALRYRSCLRLDRSNCRQRPMRPVERLDHGSQAARAPEKPPRRRLAMR